MSMKKENWVRPSLDSLPVPAPQPNTVVVSEHTHASIEGVTLYRMEFHSHDGEGECTVGLHETFYPEIVRKLSAVWTGDNSDARLVMRLLLSIQ